MTDAGDSRLLRALVGRPTLRAAALWTAVGLGWLALAIFDGPETARFVIASVWLLLGIAQGAVALSDRARHRGAYATR